MDPLVYFGIGLVLGAVIGALAAWVLKSRAPVDGQLSAGLPRLEQLDQPLRLPPTLGRARQPT